VKIILVFAFLSFNLISLIGFGYFAIVSFKEREIRAAKISLGLGIASSTIFALLVFSPFVIKGLIFILLLIGFVLSFYLFLQPIGRVNPGNDIPKTRFDERDIMFARGRLMPGTPEYDSYYVMRPENKEIDDHTRSKPGLLEPGSLYANPFLFAVPKASFQLTEALRDFSDGPVAETKLDLEPERMSNYLKEIAHYYGAVDVGITSLEPYHVYSNVGRGIGDYGSEIKIEHSFAIVMTVEMDHEMIGTGPKPTATMESAKQYVEAARICVQLANAIREMGYSARAHIDGNYQVIAPLVARDAGLGEIGRMGLLMTPRLGPRVRIGVVTTDLPLIPDQRKSNLAVIDFCNICKKCASNCPSKSIPFDDRQEIDGVLRWKINAETCFHYWNVVGTDCGRCMAVCPFSHPDSFSHNVIRWGISKSGAFRRVALSLDDLFYGKKPDWKEPPLWTQVS
jgi:reductive dehalogenase